MKYVIAAVVVLLLAGGGFYTWTELQKTESTDDAEVDGNIVSISARIGGHVTEVHVEDQQLVNKGDLLVTLDPKDYQVAISSANANLQQELASLQSSRTDIPLTNINTSSALSVAQSQKLDAQAGVAYAESQLSVAQARLGSVQANVKVAEANANKAAQDLARYKELVAKDEISKQLYDQAAAASDAAKATLDAQKAAVGETQQQIAAAQSAIQQARAKVTIADSNIQAASTGPQQLEISKSKVASDAARVEQRKTEIQQAQLNLQYTTIVAPISGIVGRKSINVGQNVAPGQQMMAIVPLDDLYITANFKETQLKRMKAGQTVKISVDAYGRDFTGKVERFAGASGAKFSLLPPENATGNYVKVVQRIPVRISIDPGQDTNHVLRPGMSVIPSVRVE